MTKIVLFTFVFFIVQAMMTHGKLYGVQTITGPNGYGAAKRCYIKLRGNRISPRLQTQISNYNLKYSKKSTLPDEVLEKKFLKVLKMLQRHHPTFPTKIGTIFMERDSDYRKGIKFNSTYMPIPPRLCKIRNLRYFINNHKPKH